MNPIINKGNLSLVYALGLIICLLYAWMLMTQTFHTPCQTLVQVQDMPARPCIWRFKKYLPSPYEEYWTQSIQQLQANVCDESNKNLNAISTWLKQATSNATTTIFSTEIFSKFTFQNECTNEISNDFIEPLAGLTRSPYFCLHGSDYVVSKDYLVVSWNMSKKLFPQGAHQQPKAYFFDLGASLYDSGAGGPSQKWFVEIYEARGIHWDGIFAWDAHAYDPIQVWQQIPGYLKPIYHWYNIPVNSDAEHSDNPLQYIKRITKPEDFVVLKLDIDTTSLEEAFVKQLLASDTLLNLIDEFYFEHHVNVGPMLPYWGNLPSSPSLVDTYHIFSTLRHKGIIAHAWV